MNLKKKQKTNLGKLRNVLTIMQYLKFFQLFSPNKAELSLKE